MDAARRAMCTDDLFNPLIGAFVQGCGMLVVSQIFHVVLQPLGQPGPIAQMWAGLVLGPSLLCRFKAVRELFIQPDFADYSLVISFIFRILFMFLIGLETDIPYLRRNFRQASTIAYGGVIICSIFGAAASFFVISILKISDHNFAFINIMMTLLANSASPVVIRLTAELKFETSDVGRLAISSSLINEMSCIFWNEMLIAFKSGKMFGDGVLCIFLTGLVAILNRFLAIWFNGHSQNQRYLSNAGVFNILCILTILSFIMEEFGYISTISCFFIGVTFPREGKTTRTLLRKLTYAVNNFILPIYFGFIGFSFNINHLGNIRNFIVVVLVILLSIGGKIIGTLTACHYLKIPQNEGMVVAFILNLKGHGELLLLHALPTSYTWRDGTFFNLMVTVVVLNTVIGGAIVSFILRREERYFTDSSSNTFLEFHDPASELRMMVCVYGSRSISAKMGLISAFSGSQSAPIVPYLMHLVELPKKRRKTKLMYHQLQDGDQFSDEEDYGGNDVLEINDAVDAFATENKVLIHQKKVVASFETMYEDVCSSAEDLRVSIIFLTFHKHQRLDGKLENGKEGFRINNQKLVRHAPCSIGLFVDRGQTGFHRPSPESLQNAAILFFGGPDDREALACSKQIASHPNINLTIVRFLLSPSREQSNRNDEELMSMSGFEVDNAVDNVFVNDFCNRYVASGEAKYMEKYVNNGAQTVDVLREIGEMYSLFIVGKGGRGLSSLTTGLSDWEECPELGTVGDLLASSELKINGSVLVIQQHRHSRNHYHLMDD